MKKENKSSNLTTAIALWWAFQVPLSSFIIHPSAHWMRLIFLKYNSYPQLECLAFVASTIKSKWFSIRSLDIRKPALPPSCMFFPFFPPTHSQLPSSLSAAPTLNFLLFDTSFSFLVYLWNRVTSFMNYFLLFLRKNPWDRNHSLYCQKASAHLYFARIPLHYIADNELGRLPRLTRTPRSAGSKRPIHPYSSNNSKMSGIY